MRNRRIITLTAAGLLLAAGAAVWLPSRSVSAQATTTPQATSALLPDEQNTVDIVRRWGPSVVAVNVEVRGSRINQIPLPFQFPPFNDLLPQQQQVQQSTGSGFVIGSNEIVTNYHVVKDALVEAGVDTADGASIKVVFADVDEEYAATVVGADPDYDLALLRLVDDSKMPADALPLELADSTAVMVGQKVIAIGNPFGLQSSVSQGIVSAIGRELPSIGRIEIPMVQTDAAINPGNSGGPLLDSRGHLIGMNTMIFSKSGAWAGIGFAVPVETIRRIVPELVSKGRVDQVGFGIRIDPMQRLERRFRIAGVVVLEVLPGTPAERSGVRGITQSEEGVTLGDIIVKVADARVKSYDDLYNALDGKKPGQKVRVGIVRGTDELELVLELTLVQ